MNWLDVIGWLIISIVMIGYPEIRERKRVKGELDKGIHTSFIKREKDLKYIYAWLAFSLVWVIIFGLLEYNISELIGVRTSVEIFGVKINL